MKKNMITLPLLALALLVLPVGVQAESTFEGSFFSASDAQDYQLKDRTATTVETAERKKKKKNKNRGQAHINDIEELAGRLVNVKIKAKAPRGVRLTCRAPSQVDTSILVQALSSKRVAVSTLSNKTKLGKRNRKGFSVRFPTGGIFVGKTSTINESIKAKLNSNSAGITVKIKQVIRPGVMCLATYKGQFSRNIIE